MSFALQTDADPDTVATLIKLTERYCVVLQTITHPPGVSVVHSVSAEPVPA